MSKSPLSLLLVVVNTSCSHSVDCCNDWMRPPPPISAPAALRVCTGSSAAASGNIFITNSVSFPSLCCHQWSRIGLRSQHYKPILKLSRTQSVDEAVSVSSPEKSINQSINQSINFSIAPISPVKPGSVAPQPNHCSTEKSMKQFWSISGSSGIPVHMGERPTQRYVSSDVSWR